MYHFVALNNIKYIGVLPLITPTVLAFTWILCPVLFNPFPSFEGYSKDAKEVWHWLTRPKDLDLCALSYLHPKGDKKLVCCRSETWRKTAGRTGMSSRVATPSRTSLEEGTHYITTIIHMRL